MPDKSRPTGETRPDPTYNRNNQQTTTTSSQSCKCLLPRSRFSFSKHLMNFSSLLFQRMARAALFYDEEGKKVSISLQGDHLYISHYSLQYHGLGAIF